METNNYICTKMSNKMINISAVSQYKEGNHLEAKKATDSVPKSVWETYSSFANTDGGIIVLGMEEKAGGTLNVTGVSNADKLVKDIWNIVNNRQKISINVLMNKDVRVEQVDGKDVIIIHVARADRSIKPVYIGDNPLSGSYRRNGDGDYQCTKEEVTAMLRDASRISQDQKVLINKDFTAFCSDTIRSYRNLFNIVHRNHVWTNLDEKTFLFKIGAADYDDQHQSLHPTAAGLLVFGYENELIQEYPLYFLDFQEHKDTSIRWTDRKVSSSGDWSGNLFDFYFSIADKLTTDLPRPFKLDGLLRVDDTMLHKAVREALLNALVNADYYGRRGVVITKSREGFTFSNPGDFRISMNEAISGGVSDPRNAVVFKIFNLVDLGERAGSGLPTIFSGWEEAYGEKPIIEESHNPDRVTLTLHCQNIDRPTQITDDNAPSQDDKNTAHTANTDDKNTQTDDKQTCQQGKIDKKQQILSYIKKNGEATVSDLAKLIGISTSQIKRYLYQLAYEGAVVAHGANKNRTYSAK